MNKSQYLAELGQLLVFMTHADREQTLSRYGALFDKAGPAGERDLLDKLGSPTRSAIRLSRVYEPILFTDDFLDGLEAEYAAGPEPEPEKTPAPAPKKAPPPDVVEGLPDLDIPPMVMDDLSAFEFPAVEPEPVPEPEEAPAAPPEETPAPEPEEEPAAPERPRAKKPREPQTQRPASHPLPAPIAPQEEEEQPEPEIVIERSVPLWLGVPLFILTLLILALPIAAICLVLLPVLILPGLVLLLFTWLAAVGGLWCISYIADAVMLFGLAFLILGLALIVLWCGLRLDVGIVKVYILAFRGVVHLTLGKKVTLDA